MISFKQYITEAIKNSRINKEFKREDMFRKKHMARVAMAKKDPSAQNKLRADIAGMDHENQIQQRKDMQSQRIFDIRKRAMEKRNSQQNESMEINGPRKSDPGADKINKEQIARISGYKNKKRKK